MSRIHVIAPGFLTTVQDLGRFGYAHFGISASGAADPLALRAGNLLVGNAANAAALEMTLTGGEFVFEGAAVIALTGSDFGSQCAAVAARGNPRRAKRCAAEPARNGARCYLAVRGGLDVPLDDGQRFGTRDDRAWAGVRCAAATCSGSATRRYAGRANRRAAVPVHDGAACLRATAGPQAALVRRRVVQRELPGERGIQPHGDPAAGPALPSPGGHMITEGVPLGAVQMPPDGQPIVLFVEHQTTGGYPKPANVISADFWRLGQLRPRDEVRFERVTMEGALGLLRDQEEWLYSL